MFQGDMTYQLKLLAALTIYALPLGSLFFGIFLKLLAKHIFKTSLSLWRSICIEFLVLLFSLIFTLLLVPLSLLINKPLFFLTVNGIAGIFLAGMLYAKMVKDSELKPIGLKKGLILSVVLTLIAILMKIR